MEIIRIRLDELTPDPNNAKDHPAWQIEQIKASIETFGNLDPIGVWGDDNIIVEGHGRYLALKELGYNEVEVIRLDWLTEDERKAYALAHNKLTMNSDFDAEMLQLNLDSISEINMALFGFEVEAPEEPEAPIFEDEAPEDAPTRCNPGDIWEMDGHRLLCGDSTDADQVGQLMNGERASMVFTDPPYGYSYKSNMSDRFEVIQNDDKMLDFFPSVKKYNDGFVYVCAAWKNIDAWMQLFKMYYPVTNVIIWDKGGGGMGDLTGTFATDYEMILVSNNGKDIIGKRTGSVWNFTPVEVAHMKKNELVALFLEMRKYNSVWKIAKDNGADYVHPTQKPVALSARAIRSSTTDGIVLDLFGGSGSTLIACEQLGRKCYICELDPKYCDVILQRWENLTGRKAKLLNKGGDDDAT